MRFFTVPANTAQPVQLGGGVAASALPSLNCVTQCNLNPRRKKQVTKYKLSSNSKTKKSKTKKKEAFGAKQVLRRQLPDGRRLKIKVPTRKVTKKQVVKRKTSKPNKGGFIF